MVDLPVRVIDEMNLDATNSERHHLEPCGDAIEDHRRQGDAPEFSVICGFADRFEGPRRQCCRTIGIDRSDVGPGPPDEDVTTSPSVDRECHSAWRLAVYGTANREPSDRESSSGRARMDSRFSGPL